MIVLDTVLALCYLFRFKVSESMYSTPGGKEAGHGTIEEDGRPFPNISSDVGNPNRC
jgi:hypothetical protein